MEAIPADIILYPVTPRSAFSSKIVVIGEMLWGKGKGVEHYSHTAIFAGGDHTLEAKWPKTGRYRMDKRRPFEVWRVEGITEFQRKRALEWAYEHLNEWYNLGALAFGLFQSKHAEVCSTYVAHAFEHAGCTKRRFAKFTSPNELQQVLPLKLVYENWRR